MPEENHSQQTAYAPVKTRGKEAFPSPNISIPMNEMLQAGVKGLEDTMAGGHPPASGGSFMRKDLDKFKHNVIEFVKKPLN